jgi:hypothetical protein
MPELIIIDGSVAVAFRAQAEQSPNSDNASYTFSVNWGVTGRLILGIYYRGTSPTPSVTVGGVSATQIGSIYGQDAAQRTVLFYEVDATSSSGNLVVTRPSGTCVACSVVVYSVIGGYSSFSATSGTAVPTTQNTATLSIPQDGCALGLVVAEANNSSFTSSWTGGTKGTTDTTVGAIPTYITQSSAYLNTVAAQSVAFTVTYNITVATFGNYLVLTP